MAIVNVLEVDIARKAFPSPVNGDAETVAIEGLQFYVPEGEFTCILGPSGSGKTTLLQLISGLDRDYDGTIRVAGKRPPEGPPVGYMFQSARLMPWLTVIDNVQMVADDVAQAQDLPKSLLEKMELGSFLHTFPNRLSGGMQRRVALARAFVNTPKLLLLDEPFISLDAPVALRLRQLLLNLWADQKATIIFVTHDLREAVHLGDRILFMSSSPGRIMLDHEIELNRPRTAESMEVEEYRQHLLSQHPAILEGIQAMESDAARGTDALVTSNKG